MNSARSGQADGDHDGAPDACDNCPDLANADQADADHDGHGDVCDEDIDADGLLNEPDNCPAVFNADQQNSDDDPAGDACDRCPSGDRADDDADGVGACVDNCPHTANAEQADADGDGVGDACDTCPAAPNAGQSDADGNGVGDACQSEEDFHFVDAGIADIQRAIGSHEMTCKDIVDGYLRRIARYDLDVGGSPPINAFVMLNEQVRQQARRLDDTFSKTGKLVGPLHCVPIVVKTNYDTADTTTTNGSFALEGVQAPDDGFAVGQMRRQGAVLIGATGMDEFAQGIQGIGGRHGKTGNAFDTTKNSGGSSAGTAAAVAASFAVGGAGTDNCGSLTVPAAYNGLVAIRSTLGLVSLEGVFPSGKLDAVAGPVAHSVEDLAVLLDAMATRHRTDPRHQNRAWRRPDSYAALLDAELAQQGLEGRRIGVLRQLSPDTGDAYRDPFSGGNGQTHRVWSRALADMARMGADIVDNVRLPSFTEKRYGGGRVTAIDAYLAGVDSPVDDFEDMCRTGDLSAHVYSSVAACLQAAEYGHRHPAGSLQTGREAYRDNRHHIERVMDALDLDALVFPVDAYGAAHRFASKANCIVTANSGLPVVAVPAGYSNDQPARPIGLMIVGRRFDEARILEIAYAYEQHTRWRHPPHLDGADPEAVGDPIDLRRANRVRRTIARTAFDRVLADGDKFDLTAGRFRAIARQVLDDHGMTYLTDQ